ncbi:hypothetical protein FB45DRAFT_872439 [Roridomyces roridus]|uniref:Uncharacterized protein n=1 Tax=Roridomyces roridus TaxID=1738132 RepID=A0AAD7FG39_9AGAR|nr:hypothetical protein FB45DRAFT_872439 [Roridomyces roridus]
MIARPCAASRRTPSLLPTKKALSQKIEHGAPIMLARQSPPGPGLAVYQAGRITGARQALRRLVITCRMSFDAEQTSASAGMTPRTGRVHVLAELEPGLEAWAGLDAGSGSGNVKPKPAKAQLPRCFPQGTAGALDDEVVHPQPRLMSTGVAAGVGWASVKLPAERAGIWIRACQA